MKAFRTALPLIATCVWLVGCGAPSKSAEGVAGNTSGPDVTAGADTTPANVALTARGAPRRADGYWEMAAVSDTGSPMRKQFYCVGGGSEEKFSLFNQISPLDGCSKNEFTRTATGWTFETRCKLLDQETAQTGHISGDFQNQFRVDQTVTQGSSELKGVIHGKRTGDCPAQFKPGDLVDDSGHKLGNMLGG